MPQRIVRVPGAALGKPQPAGSGRGVCAAVSAYADELAGRADELVPVGLP